MIRAGLIWNQHSHRNRGAGRAPLPADVLDIVPEEPSHLAAGLRRLAGEGVELVVIDGGDGTVREVLTRLPEAFGGRWPRLAVLPNGKTNALALDIETPIGTTLEEILAAAEARKPMKRRQCLEVVRAGETAPERRGFLFGAGAFVRATKLAQKNHGRGFFDDAAVGMTMAGALARTILGGAGDRWRRGDGEPVHRRDPGAAPVVPDHGLDAEAVSPGPEAIWRASRGVEGAGGGRPAQAVAARPSRDLAW